MLGVEFDKKSTVTIIANHKLFTTFNLAKYNESECSYNLNVLYIGTCALARLIQHKIIMLTNHCYVQYSIELRVRTGGMGFNVIVSLSDHLIF